MLLEFRVQNFRSIRDEQVLSLVPIASDTSLVEQNTYPAAGKQIERVLRGCAIFGPNASGKSTILNALAFFQALVRDSASKIQAGQTLNVKGFALDPKTRDAPSLFEITALIDEVRYQYGFSLTSQRIHEEWLLVYKSTKPQEWFSRTWNADSETYDYGSFSASFSGPKDMWKKATRENALFLSTAVQLNCEQLKPLWAWIVASIIVLPAQAALNLDLSLQAVGREDDKQGIIDFLTAADIGISDIAVERQNGKQSGFQLDLLTGKSSVLEPVDAEILIPKFTHTTPAGAAVFDLGEESQGTQRLFAFAGIMKMILAQGITLVIDEIENSLHPLLVRRIIELFFSSDLNPNGAQLIFVTHNTSILDNELLRRDQIWFVDKGNDQATSFTPLSDFSARKTEAFEKGYLQGRYGALPIFNDILRPTGKPHERK